MSRLRTIFIRCFLASFLAANFGLVAQACPNCKEPLESNDPKLNNVARGYYYSIIFMLGTPPVIMAGFGIAVYRAFQKAAKERDSQSNEIAEETSSTSA